MASVTSKLETVALVSAVGYMMRRLIDNLPKDQTERLSQWIETIEDAAEVKVQKLTSKQLKRRTPEVIVTAAVYDTFFEYESRTKVKVGLPFLQKTMGYTKCSINTAWKSLFDNRATLRSEFLDMVCTERNGTISDAISKVIQALERAVDESTSEVKNWLEDIETEAIELSKTIISDAANRYDSLLLATTTIYAAIKHYPGKMVIKISQRELSLLSSTSPAMISKCWLDLFGD
ncbi:hypothetical protein E4H12_02925 [Candidatus Thorarchaeota archaeon]|nr:MAG: hypothetical protein E4H12_02925 [Candidatus Thorarchaeota archaeon]